MDDGGQALQGTGRDWFHFFYAFILGGRIQILVLSLRVAAGLWQSARVDYFGEATVGVSLNTLESRAE